MAERRVAQAREDGLFDDLPLHGKPIPDLDQRRPAGWWAANFVRRERHEMQRRELEQKVAAAKPAMWRSSCEEDLVGVVVELNAEIEAFNKRTTVEVLPHLHIGETLATWRRLRDQTD